jgi:hypothetical protein
MILTSLAIEPEDLALRTGWEIKPEGACKGDVCVPLRGAADGPLDAAELADRLGMALVTDAANGLWALGPETAVTGRALTTAAAPPLELPDREGNPFQLASLLGKKVLLVAWASW